MGSVSSSAFCMVLGMSALATLGAWRPARLWVLGQERGWARPLLKHVQALLVWAGQRQNLQCPCLALCSKDLVPLVVVSNKDFELGLASTPF